MSIKKVVVTLFATVFLLYAALIVTTYYNLNFHERYSCSETVCVNPNRDYSELTRGGALERFLQRTLDAFFIFTPYGAVLELSWALILRIRHKKEYKTHAILAAAFAILYVLTLLFSSVYAALFASGFDSEQYYIPQIRE